MPIIDFVLLTLHRGNAIVSGHVLAITGKMERFSLQPPFEPVNELLAKWEAGDRDVLHALVPLIYRQLCRQPRLDDALKSLARHDARESLIVELRSFGGLSIEETSKVLGIFPATVKRDWATARVWLHREVRGA
jgi:DNA-directed RNA polymerase specialized sigma24 family protein